MAAQLMATNGPSLRGLERVERAREQLLAGAALAFEQHGGVGGGRAVQLLQHLRSRGILADDARRAAPLGQLLLAAACSR